MKNPCINCITLPMCIGNADENLMLLVRKCSLLFGYLNCTKTLDKDGIFTIYSSFQKEEFKLRLNEVRKVIPHTQTVDETVRK